VDSDNTDCLSKLDALALRIKVTVLVGTAVVPDTGHELLGHVYAAACE